MKGELEEEERIWCYQNTAVIGDLHYPVGCSDNILSRIINNTTHKDRLIINGDLINNGVIVDELCELLEQLNEHFNTIVLHSGNHERSIGSISMYLPNFITVRDYTIIDNVLITHGQLITPEMNFSEISQIMIHHIHPVSPSGNDCAIEYDFPFHSPKNPQVICLPVFGTNLNTSTTYSENSSYTDYVSDTTNGRILKEWMN